MKLPPQPANESERLEALQSYGILDSGAEATFDTIAKLAAQTCAAPIVLIGLVDKNRLWFKSAWGLPGIVEIARDHAFCAHAILTPNLMEVPDTTADERFCDNPLVLEEPQIRFYAGMPLSTPTGEMLGTLSVLDRQPRMLSPTQRDILATLGGLVSQLLLDRKQARLLVEQLANGEQRYRAIVEDQDELISLATPDCRLTYVNRAYADLHNSTPYALIGQCFIDLVPVDERAGLRVHIERVTLASSTVSDENRVIKPDGSMAWIQWSNRAQRDASGEVVQLLSVGRDITRLRMAQEATASSERRYRELYEETPAMLHSIDSEGCLVNVSALWLEILGYEREEVIGRRSTDFLTEASRRYANEVVLPQFTATGRCKHVEYQMVKKDGQIIDTLLSAISERDQAGRFARSLAVIEDVTERRQAERELVKYQGQLEHLVRARTADMELTKLEAERASRAKSEFMSRMSHELRTPMNAVLGFAQVLDLEPLTDKQRQFVAHIERAGRHLLRLIDDVLDLNRAATGHLRARREPTDLYGVVEQALPHIASMLADQLITLRMERKDHFMVMADPVRLHQVIANLLSNAVKFNRTGGRIWLDFERISGSMVRVSVCDSGIGIAPDNLKDLFVPFERLGAERSAVGGLGIGLALCERLVRAMGGKMGVRSSLGQGSCFWIDLPEVQLSGAA